MSKLFVCALVVAAVGACSDDDPISVSAPIGINLKAEEGDVKEDGVITLDKSINTEVGNPWGAFIADAEAAIGGAPGDIALDELTLLLAASSEGVTELAAVFDGTLDVQFEMNDTDNVFAVGSVVIDESTTGREVTLDRSFDYADVQSADLDKLLGGSFKVLLSAPAHAGFKDLKAKADLQLTLSFSAYE